MQTLTSGDALGRYELIAPVAQGGMAQVWAARLCGSHGFHKLVAIKTILSSALDDPRMEPMFLQEAELAARVQHPNVAATFELGDQDGLLYLVMEWVHGEPLRHVLHEAGRRGGIPLPIAVNLVGQACLGLQAAHDARSDEGEPLGIVHRDVSPHNLLVTYSGTLKVVDFGVAKAGLGEGDLTQRGELKGKLAFMSPEQLEGQKLDGRSDLFSLGGILYWMLVGRHPFRADTPSQTRSNIRSAVPPPAPSHYCTEYPKELDQAVLRALSFDNDHRWTTARAFRDALIQAVPEAFGTDADQRVADYMKMLFGDRGEVRMRQLQQTLPALSAPRASASTSLGPIAITQPKASLGPSAQLAMQNHWKRRAIWAVLAALALGLVGFVALRRVKLVPAARSAVRPPSGDTLVREPRRMGRVAPAPAALGAAERSFEATAEQPSELPALELPVFEAKALPKTDEEAPVGARGRNAGADIGDTSALVTPQAPADVHTRRSARVRASASRKAATTRGKRASRPHKSKRKRKVHVPHKTAGGAKAEPMAAPVKPPPPPLPSEPEGQEAWNPDTYGGRQ